MQLFFKMMLAVFFGLMASVVLAASIPAISSVPASRVFSAEERAFLMKHGNKFSNRDFVACNQCHQVITENPFVVGARVSPSYRTMSTMESDYLVKMIQHSGAVPDEVAKKIFSTINSLRTKQIQAAVL